MSASNSSNTAYVYRFDENMSTNRHAEYQSSTHLVGNVILTDVNCNLGNNFSFRFTPTSLSPMILGIRLRNNAAPDRPPASASTPVVLDDVPQPTVPLGPNLLALVRPTQGDVPALDPLSGFHPPPSPASAPQENNEEVPEDLPSLIPIEETADGAFLPGMFDRISLRMRMPFVNVTFAETSEAFIHAQHDHPTHPRDYDDIPHRYIVHGRYNRHNNPPPRIITRTYTIEELEPIERQLNEDSILDAVSVPEPQDRPKPTFMEVLNAASARAREREEHERAERDQSPDVKPEPLDDTTMVVEDHEALSKKSSSPDRVRPGNPYPYSLPNVSSPVPVNVSSPIPGISRISGSPDPHGDMDGSITEPETCSMTELYAGKRKASEMSDCDDESDKENHAKRVARSA
ncbi:hypothetical protein CONPUDRAFT_160266 [Coniophora puteana RWD-64-598 SS2]|uniref:Uncharacterized protein n=1 Tax=Coniophora puteana (strain RWD-64-598) TaxID=741705 RepID=R7SDJ6_CONPW|nr:uncharacterized protein CONPUDRAFT_160266 [Coniophora puteana RWD-64-598 SS2]EIW74216.1 hypothetical protein CONPUDRAFT_160266 [Coniophora puteana RWD-64-598 SS2]